MTVPGIAGGSLVLLGIVVMLGWGLQFPALVRILPEFTPMVFNTAACFLLAGVALLRTAPAIPGGSKAAAALGASVAAVGMLVLAEHGSGAALGIDWPSLHAWLTDGNPNPGRMSAPAASGFLMAGGALVLAPWTTRPWAARAVVLLAIGPGAIGAVGLIGYLIEARLLYPDYLFARLAPHTAAAMLLLSIGLWSAYVPAQLRPARWIVNEADRIALAGTLVVVAVALAIGLSLIYHYRSQMVAQLSDRVLALQKERAEAVADLVALHGQSARIAATRPAVMRNLRAIRAGTDDGSNVANVAAVVNGLVREGFSAIAYHDTDGREVVSDGTFSAASVLSVPLGGDGGGELLWSDGFVLRHRLPMRDGAGVAGSVLTEQRMPILTRMSQDPAGRGETWDMGICVRRGERLHCFPQRLSPKAFTAPLTNAAGEDLPMTSALRGERGTAVTLDYRKRHVIAAYGPIADLGIGMVVKVDTYEILRPVREQLPVFAAMLVLLTLVGGWLIRRRVKPLAEALETRNRELQDALQARTLFLSAMSHELRTPLNAIIGFTGTLLMKLPGPLNAGQEKQLRTVQTSGKHLLSLINDILDLGKIEAGALELSPKPVVCQEAMRETVETLRPLADAKGLALSVCAPADPVLALADRRALNQILLNLTANAIKFTERGSVSLRLERRPAHDANAANGADGMHEVAIAVTDTGIGIAPKDQQRLFAPFTQIQADITGAQPGTGLGLHLSQKLAGLLGGRIVLESERGAGSTFTLLLPEG